MFVSASTFFYFLNYNEFVFVLGTNRTSLYQWRRGTNISVETLQDWAVEARGGWVSEMAVRLLELRGLVIPCVCQTAIGDKGICPRHPMQAHWVGIDTAKAGTEMTIKQETEAPETVTA